MNNLSELQGELHKLSAALDALSRQVEDLKPREADETQDFSALEALARRNPIKNPTLAKAGEFERDLYLRMASTAAFLEDTGRLDKLLYLCRLAAGSGGGQSAMELQKMAYDTERLDWQSAAGELKGMALPLLLDMMMLGSMAGPADERTLDFIAGVAELMGVSEEDVTVTARLAAVLLAQDAEQFRKIDTKRAYPEWGYLVPEKWLAKDRITQDMYMISEHKKLKYKYNFVALGSVLEEQKDTEITATTHFPSRTFVWRGAILVSFSYKTLDGSTMYKLIDTKRGPITAKKRGVVYFMEGRRNMMIVYIISPFDNEDAFLTWYDEQKN